ncbi:helix-turn-helix transcriptional regulator [Citrobacter freundii]|uniref:helix-turn-helix transcriptional regulator n=2 Tax=Citrobacter TaxID=544 RepID=UPI0036709ECC
MSWLLGAKALPRYPPFALQCEGILSWLPGSISKPEMKPMRELRDDSLIDMKFMIEDAGYTAKYFYSQINAGKLPKPIKLGRTSRWMYGDYQNWKRSYQSPMKNAS